MNFFKTGNTYNEDINGHNHGYQAAKSISNYGGFLQEEEDDIDIDEDILNNDANDGGDKYWLHKVARHIFKGVETNPDSSSHDTDDDDLESNYSEKEQLIAFLLSFFVGMAGGGRFYVGDTITASIKFCLPLFICCWICFIGLFNKMRRNDDIENAQMLNAADRSIMIKIRENAPAVCCCCCGLCTVIIWWIVDWAMFAANAITDNDGKTLYPWIEE